MGQTYAQACPSSIPCPVGPPGGGGGHGFQCIVANLGFSPAAGGVEAGQTIAVDVLVTCLTAIRGWELHPTITGGSAGTLTLENIAVDVNRSNYLFLGQSSEKAEAPADQRVAAARYSGGSTAYPTKYLATLTLRASSNARGTFNVNLDPAPATKLRNADGQNILWQSAGATVAID